MGGEYTGGKSLRRLLTVTFNSSGPAFAVGGLLVSIQF